jgi:hypothetical protein
MRSRGPESASPATELVKATELVALLRDYKDKLSMRQRR